MGLAAYLNQLSLSIHRAFREPVSVLEQYCASIDPSLQDLVSRFDSFQFDETTVCTDKDIESARSLRSVALAWMQWYLRGGIVLSRGQTGYIVLSLRNLSVALEEQEFVDPRVFYPIRFSHATAAGFLGARIPNRHLAYEVNRVNHFNQNPLLKTLAIGDILQTENWLTSATVREI